MKSIEQFKRAEYRLPISIMKKSIESSNEFGWRQQNFKEVIEAARQIPMAVLGGQVQYVFEDGTCELWWQSYNPQQQLQNEDWLTYCNRSASQAVAIFDKIIKEDSIEKDALSSFEFIKHKQEQGVDIEKHKIFLICFDDRETDLYIK